MDRTTLASTDRALEKIGDFVAAQDYNSLKAVGRTFAHHLRHKATFDCGPLGANPCHLVMFRALAERVAMARAPVPSELVGDLENDFPRLMEQRRGLIRDDAATRGP